MYNMYNASVYIGKDVNLLGISTLQLLLYMLFFALAGHRLLGLFSYYNAYLLYV